MSAFAAHVILSNYPLSRAFRSRLEQHFGSVIHLINIAELRQVSFVKLVRALRQIRAERLSVAIEDEASAALLPVLELLATITRARRLQVIDMRLEQRAFTRGRAALHGVSLAAESLRAALDLLASRIVLRSLMRAARSAAVPGSSNRVAYLNCNLWFGLKAGGSVGHISGVANSLMDAGLDLLLFTLHCHQADAHTQGHPLHLPAQFPRQLRGGRALEAARCAPGAGVQRLGSVGRKELGTTAALS
jgi:hypothetical protein